MITLNKLIKYFPNNYLINRYAKQIDESWTKGRYYLGGQIPLTVDDAVTYDIILEISKRLFDDTIEITNSCEMASFQRAQSDFLEFQGLLEKYKRVLRYNGILRALVLWILPARKRASIKVWHPNNICIIDGEIVIKK